MTTNSIVTSTAQPTSATFMFGSQQLNNLSRTNPQLGGSTTTINNETVNATATTTTTTTGQSIK